MLRGRSLFNRGLLFLVSFSLILPFTFPAGAAAEESAIRCYRDEQGRIHITNIPHSPDRELIYEEPQPAPRAARVDPSVRYADLIEKASGDHRLSPLLIQAVIKAESSFQPYCVSRAGACGLMQLMPGTARLLGVTQIFDPAQNIDGGSRYLRMQLDRFGDVRLALAAYNAGPEAVQRYRGIPPYEETQTYVRRVLRFYHELGGKVDGVEEEVRPSVEQKPLFVYRGPDGQIHVSNLPPVARAEN